MRSYALLGSSCALLCSLTLGGCNSLTGEVGDVDYNAVIVPIVTQCDATPQAAVSVMEVGFAKVRAACEAFFVDATRVQQNALAATNTLDATLAAATTIIAATASNTSAAKALAVTGAGILFGKQIFYQYSTVYAFGTHLQKVRQLTYSAMDQYATIKRADPPVNACQAYGIVQEFAMKCTLAGLKDIEHQQFNIPSGPPPPDATRMAVVTRGAPVVTRDGRMIASPRTVVRTVPNVGAGVTIVPYF